MSEDIDDLVKTALEEVHQLLDTRSVLGEPLSIEGNTIIPLVSMGFGFGAGNMSAKSQEFMKGEGLGSGTGGGGGIKPVAVIIVNNNGVRVEALKGGATSLFEKVASTVAKARKGAGSTDR